MNTPLEVLVPDLGDFPSVEVIEVLVAPGDFVARDQSLITLESDKASMEIPSPEAGTVVALNVAVGDTVSAGSPVATLRPQAGDHAAPTPAYPDPQEARGTGDPRPTVEAVPPAPTAATGEFDTDILVIGAGPGGYTAAFRAADLGKGVTLVDRRPRLGGVCLNVGCIPSKALLHAAALLDETAEFAKRGIRFGRPEIDLDALNAWKSKVVERLAKGLAALAERRGVRVLEGTATLEATHQARVEDAEGTRTLTFADAILAAGSRPAMIPGFPADDDRLWSSDEAVRLATVPSRLLVIGGGIIGLEMAQVYSSLGSRVTVVELLDGIVPGADRDLVRPLERRLRSRYDNIFVGTRVTGVKARKKGLEVTMEGPKAPTSDTFDAVLVAVGRHPNTDRLGADAAGVAIDERGFLRVDAEQRTNVANIFAIGDLTGPPMLAHKATHEGKVAAEVICGLASSFDGRVIPAVAYTDPEIAWVGVSEEQAEAEGIAVDKGTIPWTASGRALGMGRADGLTKTLFDRASRRLIGVGIVGPHAGDLISEAALAIEMGAEPGDIGLTVHPHPTLSETLAFAAEAVDGTLTDLYLPKRS